MQGSAAPQPERADPPRRAWPLADELGEHGASSERAAAPLPPDAVTHWKGFALSDFQVRAIDAIRSGHNVLVSAPTGAGKTLVAEYAIEDAVRRGRRCIYTAPIKALSNQKYRDFRDDPAVDVGLLTGDVTIHPSAQVLIMTTEILRNAIFENPDSLHDVESVVFDEVHFLDDPERGSVWEESLIFAPPRMRFICLSATIANLGELGAWITEIREHELVVVESKRRPVPLHHRLFTPRRGTFELRELERIRRDERGHPRHNARYPSRHEGRGRRGDRRAVPGGRPRFAAPEPERLLDELTEQELLPALVFAFSRKDCERLARHNAARDLLSPSERDAMDGLQQELVRLFQLEPSALSGEVLRMARRGLGFHHAGMLPIDKELVERMFTSGLLKMLFTTETFAVGINMPARSVVFHSLRKFDGVSVDYVRTREYLQMAGRAGRQGIDVEGLVFSVLDERDLAEAPLERILSGEPEPIVSRFRMSYSTILHLAVELGRERILEAWEKSFNQFQHREDTRKARERNQRRQRRLVEARLALLDELGYLEPRDESDPRARLGPRGRTARVINGHEIQLTELLFQGALESLPPAALAMVFVAQVFEDRRRNPTGFVPARMFGGVRRHVDQVLLRLVAREAEHAIEPPLKLPDWGLTPAVLAWCDGGDFDALRDATDVSPGDVCRTFRMALQLLRQVRHAIDPEWDLRERLARAQELLNRDEIDARRQLELG